MGVAPKLYGEYNTVDANGAPVDVSMRKTSFLVNGVQVPYEGKIVLEASDITNYTYENIVMGEDGWNPKSFYTDEKLPAVTNIQLDGSSLSWDGQNKAICYLVFKDGVFVGQTTETTFEVDGTSSTYTVKAVNKYGSLSE